MHYFAMLQVCPKTSKEYPIAMSNQNHIYKKEILFIRHDSLSTPSIYTYQLLFCMFWTIPTFCDVFMLRRSLNLFSTISKNSGF